MIDRRSGRAPSYPVATDASRQQLIPYLQRAQAETGYITAETIIAAASELGIPEHEVYGTASFYPEFQLAPVGRYMLQICDSLACEMAGCRGLLAAVAETLGINPGETTADGMFTLEAAGCIGRCYACPAVRINDHVFTNVDMDDLHGIIAGLTDSGDLEAFWHYHEARESVNAAAPPVQRNGLRLTQPDAAGAGNFHGLRRAREMAPDELIAAVTTSGLRGRGGAGFPTGAKWSAVARSAEQPKYLICNADESEIGTFKDRYLLAEQPLLVLEGMLIAARAVGVSQAYLFLRSAYRDLIPRLEECIESLHAVGLTGNVQIEVRESPGGYICGEETALIQAIEGRRGEARLRPPYPTTAGLFGKPTVVNNVETLANVALIFSADGGKESSGLPGQGFGDKLFCISGDVTLPGLIEAPFGTTLRSLIDGAGGLRDGAYFGWAVLGGAGGRLLGPDDLDTPLTFEAGAGNGSVVVCDSTRALADILRGLLRFSSRESCGACLPCREGLAELHAAVQPENSGIYAADALASLASTVRLTSRCGLGQTATRALEQALQTYPEQVISHE